MAYPIFDETMVELTWPELEKKAKENLPVFLPVGIIEEHGPHMDLAPDVYLVHNIVKEVKRRLQDQSVETIIAPPMFWGVSKCTESFTGTFSVRPETMIAVMFDLVSSLKSWGFSKVFLFNGHGDYHHIQTIIKAIKEIKEHHKLDIYFVIDEYMASMYGLFDFKEFLVTYKCDLDTGFSYSEYADIHAGGEETSDMLLAFPNSVKKDLLPELGDSKVKYEDLYRWQGQEAMNLTPLGYCGNPSNYNLEVAKQVNDYAYAKITEAILHKLNNIKQ